MPRAPQVRAVRTRQAILARAAELFAEHGYDGTRLNEITMPLPGLDKPITLGALYHHFRTKEDLAVAVIELHHEVCLDAAQLVALTEDDGIGAAIRLSGILVRLAETDPVVAAGVRLSTESAGALPLAATNPYGQWEELTTNFLFQARGEGDIPAGTNVRSLAGLVSILFAGTRYVAASRGEPGTALTLLENAWQTLIVAILAPEKADEVRGRVPQLLRVTPKRQRRPRSASVV
jgi:AcrR family transcriptional regulator